MYTHLSIDDLERPAGGHGERLGGQKEGVAHRTLEHGSTTRAESFANTKAAREGKCGCSTNSSGMKCLALAKL